MDDLLFISENRPSICETRRWLYKGWRDGMKIRGVELNICCIDEGDSWHRTERVHSEYFEGLKEGDLLTRGLEAGRLKYWSKAGLLGGDWRSSLAWCCDGQSLFEQQGQQDPVAEFCRVAWLRWVNFFVQKPFCRQLTVGALHPSPFWSEASRKKNKWKN